MRFMVRGLVGLFLFIATIALVVLAISAINRAFTFDRPSFGRRNFERTWTVTTMELAKSSVTPQIETFGTVMAKDVSNVRAAVGGTMLRKSEGLANGAFVSQGDLLFKLDPFTFEASVAEAEIALAEAKNQRKRLEIDVANASAQIDSARSALEVAQENLTRQQSLLEQQVVSQSAVENAQNSVSSAQATYDARQFSVSTAQTQLDAQDLVIKRAELSLQRAQKSLTDTEIHAPIDGVVSGLSFVAGAPVSTQETLAVVTNPTSYQVNFQLSDAEYARYLDDPRGLTGRVVNVTWDVGASPLTFRAAVSQVSSSVEQSNGGIQVIADLRNLDADTPLRQGAFVSVRMRERRLNDIFVLPNKAVSEDGGVYIIEDGRLSEVFGTILRRLGDEIAIDLPLEAGSEIIDQRYGQLAPGVRVEIFDADAPADGNASGQRSGQRGGQGGGQAGGEGNGQRGGQGGGPGGGGGNVYIITPEQAEAAKALVEASPIPDQFKGNIIAQLDQNLLPERFAQRAGGQLGLDLDSMEAMTTEEALAKLSGGASEPEPEPEEQARPARGQGGGNGGGGQGGGQGGGGGDLVELTDEQVAKAKEFLANSPMPENRKAQIMELLDNNQMPARMANRFGSQIGL